MGIVTRMRKLLGSSGIVKKTNFSNLFNWYVNNFYGINLLKHSKYFFESRNFSE
jgi:hypothetical protein